MSFIVKVTKAFSNNTIYDLLVTAREGGSNYWMDSYKCEKPKQDFTPVDGEVYKFADYPIHGGRVIIKHDDGESSILTRATIERGLKVMANEYPKHMDDILNENYDADTADVFLQCCVFGEVVYG